MSLMPVARLGDPCSHGGVISANCSPIVLTDGIQTAKTGSIYSCPTHGPNPITGTGTAIIDGGPNKARVGDLAACGAAITAGSPSTVSGP